MKYVHELNDEFKENIKMMLCSPDSETIGLAIEILNHVNLSNKETKKHVMELILNADCGLGILFGGGKIVRKDILSKDMYYAMDEENLIEEFTFYSTKLEKPINLVNNN